ncbi:Z-DNA-binding protein 1 [Mantella aurantiaca]
MEEASRDNPDKAQRLPEQRELTKLQKDICALLLHGPPQKALAIAKAVGKTRARDINHDLYKMQDWKVLDCNEGKLWSIKAENPAAEKKAETENPKRTVSTTSSPLTDEQREIFTLLEKKRPMRAIDIAKAVGKDRAKDVNPDLYKMMNMDLLSYRDKLWTLKSQCDKRCTKENKVYEERRNSALLSDSNTDDSSSLNQTDNENQDSNLSNGIQCDSGIPTPDHTINGAEHVIQPISGEGTMQSCSKMVMQPGAKIYNIYFNGSCQNISVGDNTVCTVYSQDLDCEAGNPAAQAYNYDVQDSFQEAERPLDRTQSEDDSLNVSNVSAAEEIQGRPPRTSSPADPDQSRQAFNISAI